MATEVDWTAIASIVQKGNFSDAGDEFKSLEKHITRCSVDDLNQEVSHAELVWTFLLGFANAKNAYRNHVLQVTNKLLTVASWCAVYRSKPELHAQSEQLHETLKSKFAEIHSCGTETAIPAATAPSWPEWKPLQTAVDRGTHSGATEEFNSLKARILKSPPEEIEGQIVQATLLWTFLIDFAAARTPYRNQVLQIVQRLKESRGWMEAFESSEALKEKAAILHQDLQDALGCGQQRVIRRSLSLDDRLAAVLGDSGEEEPGSAAPTAHQDAQNESQATPLQPERPSQVQAPAQQVPAASSSTSPPPANPSSGGAASPGAAVVDAEKQLKSLIRSCKAFLDQAALLDSDLPEAAYYFRRHVVEKLMSVRKEGTRNEESDKILMASLGAAEASQGKLELGSAGQQKIVALATEVFDEASNCRPPKSVACYYLAGLLLDASAQFYDGELPQVLEERLRIAKLQGAVHLTGAVPLPSVLSTALSSSEATSAATVPVATTSPVPAPMAPAAAPPVVPSAVTAPHVSSPAPVTPAAVQDHVPAAAAAPAQTPTPSLPALAPELAAMPPSKRKGVAKKKSEEAAKSLANGDVKTAKALIAEAMQLLA